MDSACEHVDRPLAQFPQGIFTDYVFHSEIDSLQIDAYAKEIDPLKEQVRAMLLDFSIEYKAKLDLINVVDRLGVSYYFEREIANQLESIFKDYNYENNYDLYTVGVHFRVFRQHGHKMSCDVFNKFKGPNGGLQEKLKRDVKGILSLYEVAHLMMHGEDFLEEALDLATDVLSSIASESNLEDQCLYNQVVHAIKQPLYKGIKRVETRHFIGFYEEDESQDRTLLQLAKLDFNMLQLLHRQELNQIGKWWNELNVLTRLPYMRDRTLECHFWATSLAFQASLSQARIFAAKVLLILTILDDTYDAYATFEELSPLTQAFLRWDKDAIDELPVKMKWVFNFVFNLYDEIDKEMESEDRDYAARYAKARVVDIIRSYYKEASWAHQRYIPSYEDYMEEAMITSGTQIFVTSFMLGVEASIADEKGFDWIIKPVPRAIRAADVIGRVLNDLNSHEEEQRRGVHVALAVECYMHHHGGTEQEAVMALEKGVKDAWKDLNEEFVRPIDVSASPYILDLVINTARSFHHIYKEADGFTHSSVLKEDALSVYTKPAF